MSYSHLFIKYLLNGIQVVVHEVEQTSHFGLQLFLYDGAMV